MEFIGVKKSTELLWYKAQRMEYTLICWLRSSRIQKLGKSAV